LVVDGINKVTLEARVKKLWHRFLLGFSFNKFPSGRGFNVGLLEKSV
jgi:hypothetical protein